MYVSQCSTVSSAYTVAGRCAKPMQNAKIGDVVTPKPLSQLP